MISRHYEHRRLKKMADESVGQTVLDIGYAQAPNPFMGSRKVVGLDLNSPQAELPPQYVECVVGDAMDAGALLGGRTFDTVMAAELIEHLERPYDFLRAIRACMHEGSRLVLSTPNPLAPPVLFFEMSRSTKRYYTSDHRYYLPPRWVTRMLEDSGYGVERVLPVGFGHPLFAVPCPVWASYQVIYVASKVD